MPGCGGSTWRPPRRPGRGRASYLGERAIGVPDAGAAAVVVWMKALAPFIG